MNRLFIISSITNPNELEVDKKYGIDTLVNLTKSSTNFCSDLKEENLSESEFYPSIFTKSIKDYTSFVSQVSNVKLKNNKTIRDLKIDNLPIYWLTPFSVKHPYSHWLFNVFLLKNYLEEENLTVHQNFIYIPQKLAHIKEFVQDFFKENNLTIVCKSSKITNQYRRGFSSLKTNLTLIYKALSIKCQSDKNEQIKNIFLVSKNSNSYLKKVSTILAPHKNIPIKSLSFLNWYNNKSIPRELYECKPIVSELFTVFINLYKRRLNQQSLTCIVTIDGITINTDVILKEINDILIFKPHYFYSYIWLKKYFSLKKESVNFFYEDEFYEIGRVISAAKNNSNNPNIKTYGVQHGMFSDFHTVYNLSDRELLETENGKRDGLPTPDYFITWGNYFTTQFLKNNTLLNTKVKELGNPLYLFNEFTNVVNNKNQNILYCLTSEVLFYKELAIVKKVLDQHPNSTLTIRNHPNFQFNIDFSLFNVNVKISSQKEIKEVFKSASLVLSSAHSTIFLDALAYNTKVIRLKTEIYDESMDIITPNCITLNKKSKYIPNDNENKTSPAFFLNMDKKKWIELLT